MPKRQTHNRVKHYGGNLQTPPEVTEDLRQLMLLSCLGVYVCFVTLRNMFITLTGVGTLQPVVHSVKAFGDA